MQTQMRRALSCTLTCVLALLAIYACSGDGAAATSELVLPSDSLSLSLPAGPDSVVQSFPIGSSSGTLHWSASTNVPWLTVQPSSGVTPTTISVVAKSTGLQPGPQVGVITLVSSGSSEPHTIPVRLQVAPAPVIAVTPAALSFNDNGQGPVTDESVAISTGVATTLAWSVASSASWLTTTASLGSGNGSFGVHVNTTGLAAGTYAGTLTVTSALAGNSPQTVSVSLTIAPRFTVSVSASPASLGSVTGGGTFPAGTPVTVTATPSAGAEFAGWTNVATQSVVSTNPTYAFILSSDVSLVAGFRSPPVTITTSSTPAAGGSTSGGGQFASGSSVTVVATPATGYRLTGWLENGALVTASAAYTFVATQSRALVAQFTNVPATIAIGASAVPSNGGTVSGAGQYLVGASATLAATAASGFIFSNWTENGVVVSTTSPYSFVVNTPRTLVATFRSQPQTTYTVATSATPGAGGATTGGGTYVSGTQVTVVATPGAGYTFTAWTEGAPPFATTVATTASYTFTASANRTLVANFTAQPPASVVITTAPAPVNGGTATGGGQFPLGSVVTVSATPATGFHFLTWLDNGAFVSANATYSFAATQSRALVALFENSYNQNVAIAASANPSNGGRVSGANQYGVGATATLVATAALGFEFSNWTENGGVVSTTGLYSFAVSGARTLIANFIPQRTYTVTTSSNPSGAGTTSGGGSYVSGKEVSVVATPSAGYTFTNWTEAGSPVSTVPIYTFMASANRTLVANFAAEQHVVITTAASPANGGTIIGGGTFTPNTFVSVKATPNSGWAFVNWTNHGGVVATTPTYSFLAIGNLDLVANFTPFTSSTVTISATVNPIATAGTVTGTGTFPRDPTHSVTLSATPSPPFRFVNWSGDVGQSDVSSPQLLVTTDRDHAVTATFGPSAYLVSSKLVVVPDGSLSIDVVPSSVSPLVSVQASIGGRIVALTPGQSSHWLGSISLAGVAFGSSALTVTMTDSRNIVNSTTLAFTNDLPPTITIASPAATGAVANPSIAYSATCRDDGPSGCTSFQLLANGQVLATGSSTTLSGTVNLSAFAGQQVTLDFRAFDSGNNRTDSTCVVTVQAGPTQEPVALVRKSEDSTDVVLTATRLTHVSVESVPARAIGAFRRRMSVR